MDIEIIRKIVKTEREIERRIGEEKAKASEWLEGIKRDAEAKLKAEEAVIEEAYSKKISELIAIAQKEASETIAMAEVYAEKLKDLDDDILKKIILKYLTRIIPEE